MLVYMILNDLMVVYQMVNEDLFGCGLYRYSLVPFLFTIVVCFVVSVYYNNNIDRISILRSVVSLLPHV